VRRISVHELARMAAASQLRRPGEPQKVAEAETKREVEPGLDILEEVHQLLIRLPRRAREVVRLFYLEGRSYEEISTKLHIPVNTIGPVLSRAKQMLRQNLQAKAKAAGKGGTKQKAPS
jgi:RNA polymerase sigma-70 factor, ECF subfamily